MLRINEILDAVEELVQERFPDSKAYRNQVPKNFKRSSFMVSIGPQTMDTFTRSLVDRTAQVAVSLFEVVDVTHNSQVEALNDRVTLALELFSCPAIQVGDRCLDISNVNGSNYNNYAQVTFTLSWQDDRETEQAEAALAKYYNLTIEVNKKEETHNG